MTEPCKRDGKAVLKIQKKEYEYDLDFFLFQIFVMLSLEYKFSHPVTELGFYSHGIVNFNNFNNFNKC